MFADFYEMLTFGPGAAVEHMPKCQVFAVIKFESRMIFSSIKMSPGIGFFWHRTDAIQRKNKRGILTLH